MNYNILFEEFHVMDNMTYSFGDKFHLMVYQGLAGGTLCFVVFLVILQFWTAMVEYGIIESKIKSKELISKYSTVVSRIENKDIVHISFENAVEKGYVAYTENSFRTAYKNETNIIRCEDCEFVEVENKYALAVEKIKDIKVYAVIYSYGLYDKIMRRDAIVREEREISFEHYVIYVPKEYLMYGFKKSLNFRKEE